MQRIITVTVLALGLLLSALSLNTARAQTATPVECGTTVQGEFTKNNEQQDYTINVKPGYQVNVNGRAVGDTLIFRMALFGPTGVFITNHIKMSQNPLFKSGILSARGTHTITTYNTDYYNGKDGGVGVYTLKIDCIDENGKPVTPAAPAATTAPATTAAPAGTPAAAPPATTATPAFSGVGFPGLPPVDFSDVALVPLKLDKPINGAVGPRNSEILGYTFDAKANNTLDLSFKRESGNLNLGLVVLSADNKVYFQTSFVTSSALSTTLTLPTAGKYTIGIFRISLVEPKQPAATAFELQARLRER
jgi:hypothetical protein